jgi:hypothetical protein
MSGENKSGFKDILTIISGIFGIVAFILLLIQIGLGADIIFIWISIFIMFLCCIVLAIMLFSRKRTGTTPPPPVSAEKAPDIQQSLTIPQYFASVRISIDIKLKKVLENNRREKIEKIEKNLEENIHCLFITGVKGIGKSTLAAYFAEPDDF